MFKVEKNESFNITTQKLIALCDFMGISTKVDPGVDLVTEVIIRQGVIAGENGKPNYHGWLAEDVIYPEEGTLALENVG